VALVSLAALALPAAASAQSYCGGPANTAFSNFVPAGYSGYSSHSGFPRYPGTLASGVLPPGYTTNLSATSCAPISNTSYTYASNPYNPYSPYAAANTGSPFASTSTGSPFATNSYGSSSYGAPTSSYYTAAASGPTYYGGPSYNGAYPYAYSN